jgi:hypothetical protein
MNGAGRHPQVTRLCLRPPHHPPTARMMKAALPPRAQAGRKAERDKNYSLVLQPRRCRVLVIVDAATPGGPDPNWDRIADE